MSDRAYHGTSDLAVPFDGGPSLFAGSDEWPRDLVAMLSHDISAEFAEFAADAGCDFVPDLSQIGDDVTQYNYVGCVDGTPITFFEVAEAGHTWPNTPILEEVGDALGYTTTDVDAAVDSWAFFQQHSLNT